MSRSHVEHQAHDPDEVARLEAASVLLAREANDLSESLLSVMEWSERQRRQRTVRTMVAVVLAIVVAIWLHDEHTLQCHIADNLEMEAATRSFCDFSFPLHGHGPEEGISAGDEDRILGLVFYGSVMVLGIAMAFRDPKKTYRHSSLEEERAQSFDTEKWASARASHRRRLEFSRPVEVLAGGLLTLTGFWLILPLRTFDGVDGAQEPMTQIAPEPVWGLVMVVIGTTAAWVAFTGRFEWRRRLIWWMFLGYLAMFMGRALTSLALTSIPIFGGLLLATGWSAVQLGSTYILPEHHSKNS